MSVENYDPGEDIRVCWMGYSPGFITDFRCVLENSLQFNMIEQRDAYVAYKTNLWLLVTPDIYRFIYTTRGLLDRDTFFTFWLDVDEPTYTGEIVLL